MTSLGNLEKGERKGPLALIDEMDLSLMIKFHDPLNQPP